MTEIKNKQDAQEVQLNKLEKEVAEVKGVNTKLEREIVDIRARSMRSNLIFYNVPEEAHENPEQVVRSVITKMGIEDGKGIEMERIHRMGKQSRPSHSHGTRVRETSQTSRPRPIIVKFLRHQDKENIRKAAHMLKGTNRRHRRTVSETNLRRKEAPLSNHETGKTPRAKGINGIRQTVHKWSTLHGMNKSRHIITSRGGK